MNAIFCKAACSIGVVCLFVVVGSLAEPAALGADGAAPVSALTLESALRQALEHNPGLRSAAAQVEAAQGRAVQSRQWANPDLELSAEDWPVNGGGFSDAKKLAGVSQTVPFPGKKKWDKQAGAAAVRVTEAELAGRRADLAREVKSAFYEVLAAERLAAVADELVKVAETFAETARKRVAAGAAPDQELLRAEIPLEQARAERADFQRQVVTARQALALAIGRSDLPDVPVAGALSETPNLALLDRGPEVWLATHPRVAAAQAGRDRAEKELRRARLEPYPDVKVGAAGGQDAGQAGSIIQFSLAFPLPIIDRAKGKRQEARANQAIAAADVAAVEQRLLRDWRVASGRLRSAAARAAAYRERILPKAAEALRLVQTGFETGKFGFIDLLDTQRTAAEARLAHLKILLEMNLAQAELEALAPPVSAPVKL
jgi:outer membrane protein, heavy metal efflux system